MSTQVVIVEGLRTPQGVFGGALKSFTAQRLGELVIRELLTRTRVRPDTIEEVVFGCVGQTSDAPNVARVIALLAGLPNRVPAYTVPPVCKP